MVAAAAWDPWASLCLYGVSFHRFFMPQPQSNHTSYTMPQGFKGMFLRKRAMTFYDLASEIMHYHFETFYSSRQSEKPAQVQREER